MRNEALIRIVQGRKLDELRRDKFNFPHIYDINHIAVVMDLAKYYHTFAKEIFPNVLRIADRFHVNRYVLDVLQNVRRRISINLSPSTRNRVILKQNKNLLSKRQDSLIFDEIKLLSQLLTISSDLEKVYIWKEELIEWYDCCINVNQATIVFDRWLRRGHSLEI